MQPIFSRNIDIEKMAFMNWRIEGEDPIGNMINIADGYMRGAIALAKVCIADNSHKRADIIIFPILNNINHGIELYLKAINWSLNGILKRPQQVEGRHNIRQIYETVRSKIKVYKGQILLSSFDTYMGGLKGYIDELYVKTEGCNKNDKMDFSRYPFSTGYENHFYVGVMGTVHIDLLNFIKRFKKIRRTLHKLSEFVYHHEYLKNWE